MLKSIIILAFFIGITKFGISQSVIIGSQVWSTKNLDVTSFRNGDPIPQVKTNEEWEKAGENKQSAWCYYENDSTTSVKYGILYNWFAVNDIRELAMEGWHIPSESEWINLMVYLGGKDEGTQWQENAYRLNEIGFEGIPSGIRDPFGSFNLLTDRACWWGSTAFKDDTITAYDLGMDFVDGIVSWGYSNKMCGITVRCIKD